MSWNKNSKKLGKNKATREEEKLRKVVRNDSQATRVTRKNEKMKAGPKNTPSVSVVGKFPTNSRSCDPGGPTNVAGGGLMAFGACCIVSRACFEETVSALLRGSQSRKSRVPRIIPFLASALGVFSLLSDSCLLLVLTPPCFFLPVFVFSHRSDRSSTLSLFCLSHSPHIPLSFGFLFCFLKTIFRIFCFVSLFADF